jgi:hypothetical protein
VKNSGTAKKANFSIKVVSSRQIIEKKGFNEFTAKEVGETIGKSTVNVSRILREKLEPNGYVKVKKSAIITKKRGNTKIYYLAKKK